MHDACIPALTLGTLFYDHPMSAATPRVTLDDSKARVTTWTFGADGDATGVHRHEYDYIVVPITGGTFVVTGIDGSERTMTQIAGAAYTGRCGTEHNVTNASGGEAVFVEVELRA
jgi:hypothetical protein